mgnify:CR=1 FL=1
MRSLIWVAPLCAGLGACNATPDPIGLQPGETLLSVTGTGRTEATPDQALFTAGTDLGTFDVDVAIEPGDGADADRRLPGALGDVGGETAHLVEDRLPGPERAALGTVVLDGVAATSDSPWWKPGHTVLVFRDPVALPAPLPWDGDWTRHWSSLLLHLRRDVQLAVERQVKRA